MHAAQWLVLDTALGPLGLAWQGPALIRVLLPDQPRSGMQASLQEATGTARPADPLPPWVQTLAEDLCAHLSGEPRDFTGVPVQLVGYTDFTLAVLHATRQIPPGQVRTYGQLARQLGRPGAARAVGGALGRNPLPLVIPCHRVVGAAGAPGGFTSPGGLDTKRRLLACEGLCLPG